LTISVLPYGSFRIYFGTLIPAESKESVHSQYASHPVMVSLGQGAEYDYHLSGYPYSKLGMEDASNQSNELRALGPLFLAVMPHVLNKENQIRSYDLS
jgi:hypothetical protein